MQLRASQTYQNNKWAHFVVHLARKPGLEGLRSQREEIVEKLVDIPPYSSHQSICLFLIRSCGRCKPKQKKADGEAKKWNSLILLRHPKLEVRAEQGVRALKNASRFSISTPGRLEIGVKDNAEINLIKPKHSLKVLLSLNGLGQSASPLSARRKLNYLWRRKTSGRIPTNIHTYCLEQKSISHVNK